MAFVLLFNPLEFPIYLIFIIISISISVAALGFAYYIIRKIKVIPEGTEKMKEIAKAIREGANTYLHRQYKTILKIGIPLAIILLLAIDLRSYILTYLGIGAPTFIWISFLIGMTCSLASGYISMYTATQSNVRTAYLVKEKGISEGLEVAFNGGMVMGLCVVGLSLLAIVILFLIFSFVVPVVSPLPTGFVDLAEFQAKNIEGSIIGLAFGASFAA
ncbi:MAG: sodium/proton-translocating pyrophosphatase, partial [Candidatus Helarchaeota archaeon]